MKYYSSLIRLLLAILMISILSFQPYIASAEETTATGDVEVETDELEDIDYDTDDTDGVFLDIDVIPDDYDHSVYSLYIWKRTQPVAIRSFLSLQTVVWILSRSKHQLKKKKVY